MRELTPSEIENVELDGDEAVVSFSGRLPEGAGICHRDDASEYFWAEWETQTGRDRGDLTETAANNIVARFTVSDTDILAWVV